jgi:hypothetical protein
VIGHVLHHLTWRASSARPYPEDLSKKLQNAKLEILKLGRKPKLYSKECQTTYAELWVRNFLDEDDVAERRSGWVPRAVEIRHGKSQTAAGKAATAMAGPSTRPSPSSTQSVPP